MSIPASVTQAFPPEHGSGLGGLEEFLKSQPIALGTVQIMVGVVVLMLGINVQAVVPVDPVYVILVFLGTLMYTATGIITVLGGNRLDRIMIKACFAMNVICGVTAAACCGVVFIPFSYITTVNNKAWTSGIVSVQLILSALQFIISICISVFACKAICYQPPPQMPVHDNIYITNTISGKLEEVYEHVYDDVEENFPPAGVTKQIRNKN